MEVALAPPGQPGLADPPAHALQFYDTDDELEDLVVPYLVDGIAAGGILVIATSEHRKRFADALLAHGVDPRGSNVLMLDAEESLGRFMQDGAPDPARFRDFVDAAMAQVTRGDAGFRVRAFGEMVDVLWRRGEQQAAIQLEHLWNDAQRGRTFDLLCAYTMSGFYKKLGAFDRVCATHSHLLPTPRRLDRRAGQLLQVTAAIADAVTEDEVQGALVESVGAAIGASSVGLYVMEPDGRAIRLVRSFGYLEGARDALANVSLDVAKPIPAIDCVRNASPIWIESQDELLERYPQLAGLVTPGKAYRIACLPLLARGEALGCLAMSFDDAPPLDPSARDFLQLIARYGAQAVERLRLLAAERDSRARAELLYGLARVVIVAHKREDVYEAALDALERGLGARRAAILTYGHDPVMRFRAWRGISDGYRFAVEGHSPWTRDAVDPQPVIVPDVTADLSLAGYLPLFRAEKISALAFIPLMSGPHLLGKFMLYFDTPHRLAAAELDLARAIADHVAGVVTRFAGLDELRETVRFNEMFTGVLGHDLRNPLGAIVTAAQLAIARSTSEKVTRPLSRILTSSARMSRMIEQLLDFTRVRVGHGIPLTRAQHDLMPLIRQVMDELEDASPEWRLTLQGYGDTCGTYDADRLAQVFSNLIANAIQHGDMAAGVRVEVDGSAADRIRVEVHNMGEIPVELIPAIFDPMSGGSHRRHKSSGLGLGLYISRQLVLAHGGTIEVRSDARSGTRFRLELPRKAMA